MTDPKPNNKDEISAHLTLYSDYNKTLRAWFVAFGIGAPAIFVTSSDAREFLWKLDDTQCVIIAFLIGVLIQVLVALLNKSIAWSAYYKLDLANRAPDKRCNCICLGLSGMENWYWIDVVADILSITLFGMATCNVRPPCRYSEKTLLTQPRSM